MAVRCMLSGKSPSSVRLLSSNFDFRNLLCQRMSMSGGGSFFFLPALDPVLTQRKRRTDSAK